MAAEVLEPNPAHAFYAKVGYAPVSWTALSSLKFHVICSARGLVAVTNRAGAGTALTM